jgi:hypothetical protein
MLKSLERAVRSVEQRIVLLAPDASVPARLNRVHFDALRHQRMIWQMQKLRGSVYLHDGAVVRAQLSPEGLHKTPEDDKSWHLLMLNSWGQVTACAWYLEHANTIRPDQLRVRNCPLAKTEVWRDRLWKAIESELATARRDDLGYAEVGGWAVAEESRCSTEGLLLALAGYSLGRVCGGALGITTATVRHCSSAILRKIGGAGLQIDGTVVPSYYDPRYDCEMEILRFDSRTPDAKYAGLVEQLCERLMNVLVIAKPQVSAFRPVETSLWTRLVARRGRGSVAALAS